MNQLLSRRAVSTLYAIFIAFGLLVSFYTVLHPAPAQAFVFCFPGDSCGTIGGDPRAPNVLIVYSATPQTVPLGSSTVISWSGQNATSCVGSGKDGFNPGGKVSGSQTITPSKLGTNGYWIRCSSSTDTETVFFDVTTYGNVGASCSVSPSTITTGNSATWSANASGGSGSYAYLWSGTDGLVGTSKNVTKVYTNAGTKTASVKVTSGSQSLTQSCSNNVTVTAPIAGTCSASDTDVNTGEPVTWTVSPSCNFNVSYTCSLTAGQSDTAFKAEPEQCKNVDENGPLSCFYTSGGRGGSGAHFKGVCDVGFCTGYSYAWSGTDGLSGSGLNVNKTYTIPGTKSASVVVTSPSGSKTISCSNTVSVSSPPPPSPQCSDGIDNDGDGLIDSADYGCSGGSDTSESPNPQCSDGIDNNGNGLIDYPDDLTCSSSTDNNEEIAPLAGVTLTATQTLVQKNQSTTLNWSASNVKNNSCNLAGTNGDSWNLSGTSGSKVTGALTGETTYTLSCTDLNKKPVSTQVTVKVAPSFEEI